MVAPEDQTATMKDEIEHFRAGPEKKRAVPFDGRRA
jgi:hypothetical protein